MKRREFLARTALGTGGLFAARSVVAACMAGSGAQKPPHRVAGSRTFYVDASAGNDRNDGLEPSSAWRTLERVNQEMLGPGDHVLFRAGTRYTGQLKPRGSGASVDGKPVPVVIGRYGEGAKPRIDGEGKVPYTVYLYNVAYFEVGDLEITNTGPEREAGRRGVCVHLEDFGTAHRIVLKRLHVHDVNGSLVKNEGGGSGIVWMNGGRSVRSRFDGLLIEGCHIQRCGRNGIDARGYSRRDNWYPSLHVVVRGNLLEEVPGDGIVPIGCDGALVEYNVMRNCPRLLPEGEAAAGIWPWSCDNTVIQHNEVSDHKAPWDAQGFDSDWNCRNTLIQYNYSHDNEGGFLLVCDNGEVGLPSSVGNLGTVVRYNVSINDGLRTHTTRAGIFSPSFHISGPVKDTKIYNNLIYVSKKPPGVDRTLIQMDNWGGPWPEKTLFANNIFYIEGEADWDNGKAIGTVFDHNLYFGDLSNLPEDGGAVLADPQFVDPPRNAPSGIENLEGYRLRPGSPAAGAGRIIAENGGRDFSGKPVPADKRIGIGPFEPDR